MLRMPRTEKPDIGIGLDFDDTLVGHWAFNEGAGGICCDGSGNGNNGTLIDRPRWRHGALFFDGAGAHVVINDADILDPYSGSFSVGFWIRTAQASAMIVEKYEADSGGPIYEGYYFYITAGQIRLFVEDGAGFDATVQTTATYNDGKKHYVVGVLDRSTDLSYIYVDGREEDTVSIAAVGEIATPENLQFGERNLGASPLNYEGFIDQVSIYNRALSAAEIKQLYINPNIVYEPKWIPYSAVGVLTLDLSDSFSMADAHAGAVGLTKTDLLAIADAIAQAMGKNVTDTLSIADVLSIVEDYGLPLADAFALADSLTTAIAMQRTYADSFSITDSLVATLAELEEAWQDSFSITDSLALFIYTIIVKRAYIEDDEYQIKNIHLR